MLREFWYQFDATKFFDIINLRVSGEALEVIEQNRRDISPVTRLTEFLDDSNIATEDDVITCKDLLRTRFKPIQHDTKNDWMADLRVFKQEKNESLVAYFNRASIFLKNLDLIDGKSENTTAESHLLSAVCMAYYSGLYDISLKRRIQQVKGWSKCISLSKMHALVIDKKNDMEQEQRVE
ncbi:hypothetical protein EV44_g3511 [Erysiphe necator]|uniref:Retrotransposon gag domain-containing protein n=1 Tax=Uncinula necator TaxID=52586 RepID=A0A0B1P7M2_UNCNE|nr:hypothetical protein EV44_g3511 [Erysiphe necator]